MQAAHFVNRQLVFVNGKLNELMLPKRASKQRGRKRKELISAKEKWGRRKQKKKYYGAAAVEEQLQRYPVDEDVENDNGTLPRSPLKSVPTEIVTGQEVSVDEMNDEEVYQYTTMLKQQYGNVVDGLDFSGQGQCVKGRSLPRFHIFFGGRFVLFTRWVKNRLNVVLFFIRCFQYKVYSVILISTLVLCHLNGIRNHPHRWRKT